MVIHVPKIELPKRPVRNEAYKRIQTLKQRLENTSEEASVAKLLEAEGFEIVETRVTKGHVIYKKGDHRVAYDPKNDEIAFEYDIHEEW